MIGTFETRQTGARYVDESVKFISILCLGIALTAAPNESLRGQEDEPPHRRGGFQASTPKPVAKKSAASESTPMPKKKKKAADDDATAGKKTETPSGKSAESEEKVSATPKKKRKQTEDEPPAEKKAATSEASAMPPKTSDAEAKVEPSPKPEHAPAATLEPSELAEFFTLPSRTQALITAALALTKLNLTYTYGSDEPAQGGMDCSGTMAYVLRSQGFKDVPRDSSSQYVWARKGGPFFAVVSKSAESFEFKDLQPGDLLFWSGTYETNREIPISHVMLYLGTEKKSKKRVMFGSSDGRSYAGIQRWGVSVFDFKMPNGTMPNGEKTKVDFVGYGRIPGLRERAPSETIAEKTPAGPDATVTAEATPKPRNATTSSSGNRKKRKHTD